jgi:DNA-binding transcriptional MerR regulator
MIQVCKSALRVKADPAYTTIRKHAMTRSHAGQAFRTGGSVQDQVLFAVGDLARRIGVTVRTIQYYDQQGLLSPSAKGPNNQRLYTESDVSELYRILTLKYLGLPLSQIKEDAPLYRDSPALHALTNEKMDEIEADFQKLFRRLTALRAISESTRGDTDLDWEAIAATIERHQGEEQFFWRLTCISDGGLMEPGNKDEDLHREMIGKWHALIADAIRLMTAGEPPDSPRSQELAKRYLELDKFQKTLSANQNFILMENIAADYTKGDSFDKLRQSVFDYLESLAAAHMPDCGDNCGHAP